MELEPPFRELAELQVVALQGIEPSSRYHVCLQSDPEVRWLRRSLKTLSCFVPDSITVSSPSP